MRSHRCSGALLSLNPDQLPDLHPKTYVGFTLPIGKMTGLSRGCLAFPCSSHWALTTVYGVTRACSVISRPGGVFLAGLGLAGYVGRRASVPVLHTGLSGTRPHTVPGDFSKVASYCHCRVEPEALAGLTLSVGIPQVVCPEYAPRPSRHIQIPRLPSPIHEPVK